MTTTTKEYADLASDAYKQPNINNESFREDAQIFKTQNGREFLVLANASNPKTGYQGTIYQDKISNEIIVSHRGTEPKDLNDVKADGQMASQRDNMQIADAMALTQRALNIAKTQHLNDSRINPTVSVTGHSLGGALAQVTAYKLGLHGETFNSYGAADLKGIPKNAGHGQVINHVIATDMVSSAAPHFGDVKIYARESDILALTAAGFGRYNMLDDRTNTLASASLGSAHLMKYFTAADSVLNDEQALKRAELFHDTISTYRQDVYAKRDTISEAMAESPKTLKQPEPIEQRYHGSYEFNHKGEYKNYDSAPNMMGGSSHVKQALSEERHTPKKTHTEPNPVEQRYHGSYEFNDKGEYKNYDRKPSMFGGSSDASDVLSTTLTAQAALSDSQTNLSQNKPAETSEPIVLPRNIASLHEQLTEKLGDKLTHLNDGERDTVIAMATEAAVGKFAKTVDYVHINEQGKVLMGFDGNIGYSNTVNINDAHKFDAQTMLTASVDLQQNQMQDLANRQTMSQTQNGLTISL